MSQQKAETRPARETVPVPGRMGYLPRDSRGYIIPWFVQWRNGLPLFPVMDARKWRLAVAKELCWVCGEQLGRFKAFVAGPMCTINRIASDPPSHLECATYSAMVCPYLSTPRMGRVPERVIGEPIQAPSGYHSDDNPGAVAIWVTRVCGVEYMHNGPLISFGDPESVTWWAHGRKATAAEAKEAFDKGAARLHAVAELDGPAGVAEFERLAAVAARYLPK
jgi:hypothetical protein